MLAIFAGVIAGFLAVEAFIFMIKCAIRYGESQARK